MNIFLMIIGELATMVGSAAIKFNAGIDAMLEIANKGYITDKETLDKLEKRAKEEQEKFSGAQKILNTILFWIPGVNLIYSSISSIKMKKELINDSLNQNYYVPMTEEEKRQYAKIKGKIRKLMFLSFNITKKDNEEFLGFLGNIPIVCQQPYFVKDQSPILLDQEQMIIESCTLDEVKKLNNATTYSYRIGKVDNRNIAIIGIPNVNYNVERIQFENESNEIIYKYENMTEEEACDKSFVTYLFNANNIKDVQNVVEEIKQSYMDSAANTSLKVSQTYCEQNYSPMENEENLNEEHGPVFKKVKK